MKRKIDLIRENAVNNIDYITDIWAEQGLSILRINYAIKILQPIAIILSYILVFLIGVVI